MDCPVGFRKNFLYGEVGFSKVGLEFIDDRVVDEGFGGGLHQAVADFVQMLIHFHHNILIFNKIHYILST